jgi:hypothetical protein
MAPRVTPSPDPRRRLLAEIARVRNAVIDFDAEVDDLRRQLPPTTEVAAHATVSRALKASTAERDAQAEYLACLIEAHEEITDIEATFGTSTANEAARQRLKDLEGK